MAHDHSGHAHHGHGRAHTGYGRAFAIGIALNLLYVAGEAVAGILSGSLALLADAGHNLGDVLGLSLSWGAAVLGRRQPSGRFTYGLRSSSILAALANAIILLVVTGGIAWEAIWRIAHPVPVAERHRDRRRCRRHLRQWRDGAAVRLRHRRPQCKERLSPPGGRRVRHRRCRGRRHRDLVHRVVVARSAGQPHCFGRHRLRHLESVEECDRPRVGRRAGRGRHSRRCARICWRCRGSPGCTISTSGA